jgi:hypothetical protein
MSGHTPSELVYAAISDAYYEARNNGRTMTDAAAEATIAVETIFDARLRAAESEQVRRWMTEDANRADVAEQTLAAVAAATDDAARHLGHAHPVVVNLRKALGAS